MLPTLQQFILTGKIILVTGAARGLGFEIAKALAGAGGHVVLNGRDAASLDAAAARIENAGGGSVETAPLDITDSETLQAAFKAIAAKHGRLDVLVNNVGARNRKPLLDFAEADIRGLIENNLLAGLFLAREAAQLMLPHESGRLVAVTSIAGELGRANDAVYTAAKAGLTGLVRALAAEFGRTALPATRSRRASSPPKPMRRWSPTRMSRLISKNARPWGVGGGRRRSPAPPYFSPRTPPPTSTATSLQSTAARRS
jgi:gluconate 5-dehydrogenase